METQYKTQLLKMNSEIQNRRARVVLVGSGRMGQLRAAILYANPRFDMCGIVDVNEAGATALARKFSAVPFTKLRDAIEYFGVHAKKNSNDYCDKPEGDGMSVASESTNSDASATAIDAIVISAPTFVHDEVIREAAGHGLFIFTEKPVDDTAEKIANLFEVCKKEGAQLCCGFQRRFDESYLAAATSVKDGKIGKPVTASIFFGDHPCPPIEFLLTGGNLLMDCSAHDVDFIRWALEDEVDTVYATGSSSTEELGKANIHDNATMVMKFKKGTVVTLTLSRSACYGYDQRCEVFGTEGLVAVGNEYSNTSVLSNTQGVNFARLKHSFPQRFNQAFSSEMDAFADTILCRIPWSITDEDCIAAQRVADAAIKSCETGEVVKL